MTITYRIYIISLIVVAGLAAATTRFYFPQVQSKTVTVEHEVEHNNIVTVTHTVHDANGAVDTTTTVTDHSTKIESNSQTALVNKPLDWHVGALVGMDVHKGLIPIYGASLDRRILGPVTVGGFGLTNGTIGVSIGLSF